MFNGEADKIGKNLIEKFTSNNFNPDINTKYNKTINERRKLVLESQPGNDPDIFAINLIESCLKIVKSDDNGAFEFLIQLFFVLFSMPHFEKLPKLYETDIINLPPKYLIQMIPQISKHLAKDATLQLIERLFCVISGYDFQSVFFSLNLYAKNDPNNLFSDQYFENDANIIIKESKNAHQILNKIIFDENKYSHANECKLIDEGFVKASQSVFEKWKFGLEKANERKEIRDKVLSCLFKEYHLLNSDLDQLFISNFNEPVQICEKLFHENTKESKNKMWTILHSLYNQLTKVVNQLNSIVLKKSSPELSKYKFHQMKIFGDYFENDYERENEKNNNSNFRNHLNSSTINEINLKQLETANNYNGSFLCSINDVLEIMGTQQRPRLLQLLSSNGKLYKFLLKSNEDLRLDQRVIQFFRLLNFFLKKYHDKRNLLEITCYTVVPLRVDCGLIRFVNNTESFSQIVNTIRTKQKTPINIESILNAEFSSEPYIKMNNLQKYEFFNYVFENQEAKELFDSLFHQSRNAIDFCRKVKNFTRSTALMSMVGHIIGLGDRHPSNILIDLINGLVVHIDFGDSFEKAQHRKEFPEKVPFRLTKMFLNSIEAGKGGGTFASGCVEVIKLIRKKKISLSAQLTVFLKELEDDKSKIEKVTQKINGCEFGYQMTPEEQVHKLINIAIDPMNYIQHYQGWYPFW